MSMPMPISIQYIPSRKTVCATRPKPFIVRKTRVLTSTQSPNNPRGRNEFNPWVMEATFHKKREASDSETPGENKIKKSRNAKHFLVSMEVLLATCDTFLGCDEPCTLIQGCLFGQVYFLNSIPVRCHCHPLSSFLSRDQTSTQRPTSVEYPSVDVPLRS